MEKKRVYFADIHMNAGWGEKSKHPYEWLAPEEAERFAKFLEYLNDPETDVQEAVIIGDLLDDWVYPHDLEPPSLAEILEAPINDDIVKALRELSDKKEINVLYLPGNHDMGVTRDLAKEAFGEEMVFGGLALHNSIYRTSRLRAEHGSAHAMFNAPPVQYGGGVQFPLGYFISRVVATKTRDTGSARRHYWSYADDVLEMVGPEKMASCVFEAVVEEAGLDDNTRIIMPSKRNGKAAAGARKKTGKAAAGGKKKTGKAASTAGGGAKKKDDTVDREIYVTVKDIKEIYADLYDRWECFNGKGSGFRAVMAEIGLLGRVADRLCTPGDTNIVVFGHSHDWALDKDKWFVSDRIYANCGTWCDDKKKCTWVESQKDRENNRHFIRVMDWNNGAPVVLKKADVPL